MNLQTLLTSLLSLINNQIIPLLIAMAVVALFWGIVKYIFSSSSAVEKANGAKIMSAGIIGLVVMICIWGIVALVSNTIGINGNDTIVTPVIHGIL